MHHESAVRREVVEIFRRIASPRNSSEMMSLTRHPDPESSSGDSGSPEIPDRFRDDVVLTKSEQL